jgi:hypothetical protein
LKEHFDSIFRAAGRIVLATFFVLNMTAKCFSETSLETYSAILSIAEDNPLENLKFYMFERNPNFM